MVTAAGFLIVRKVNNDWEYLNLVLDDGDYDFPKGKVDKNDTDSLHTALRELFEESNIKKKDFLKTWGGMYYDSYSNKKILRMYIAQVNDKCDIKLKVNPEHNSREHVNYKWNNYNKTISKLKKYLVGCLDYYKTILEEDIK